jgi:mono/diheme cytochrome c family protein
VHCAKCHGADGTGSPARGQSPEIPDFTKPAWQARRTDAGLLVSVLDGKGRGMPPWRDKLSEGQARGLVSHVRAFAPTRAGSGQGERGAPANGDFDQRFRRLEKQLDDLRSQYHELSKTRPGGTPSKPSRSGPREGARQSGPAAPATSAAAELFRRRCVKCHGADGTGDKARGRLPEIPNFTDASWRRGRTDAALVESVLDGKGAEMPPWRGEISEGQARGLVAYVRTFATTSGKSGRDTRRSPAPAEPKKAKTPPGSSAKR